MREEWATTITAAAGVVVGTLAETTPHWFTKIVLPLALGALAYGMGSCMKWKP